MEKKEKISIALKLMAGICAILGVIALGFMISDFVEFGSYLAYLRQGIPDYIWNDPQIQSAISEGYAELARIPLTVAIPMFIIAIISFGANRALANKSGDTTQGKRSMWKQIKPLTGEQEKPSTVKQVKISLIKQVKPITS